eukprot:527067-Rhodomonas_salina.1
MLYTRLRVLVGGIRGDIKNAFTVTGLFGLPEFGLSTTPNVKVEFGSAPTKGGPEFHHTRVTFGDSDNKHVQACSSDLRYPGTRVPYSIVLFRQPIVGSYRDVLHVDPDQAHTRAPASHNGFRAMSVTERFFQSLLFLWKGILTWGHIHMYRHPGTGYPGTRVPGVPG